MAQYCRYCAFCFEADDFRCSNHPKGKQPHWDRAQISKVNHCPNFALSDCGDVITGRPYKPRTGKPLRAHDGCEQLELWNGVHGQVVAPAGTFKKIRADESEGDDI